MYRIASIAFLGCLLVLSVPAAAEICDLDEVPAATLLLPYFEVTLGPTSETDTAFLVQNAEPEPVIAHVVIWSDLAVPVYAFPIPLTGFDTTSVSMRDVLVNGALPNAEPDFPDEDFEGCTSMLPLPDVPLVVRTGLQQALTGQPASILGGLCAGTSSPGVARGFVTIDAASECSVLFPDHADYFKAGGTGVATNENVLTGNSYMIDRSKPLSHAQPMVHIEADGQDPRTSAQPGNPKPYTFYARMVKWSARDNREPLATDFGIRFMVGSSPDYTTDLFVWRDPKVNQKAFACPPQQPPLPRWRSLTQKYVRAFDESANFEAITGTPFPVAAQRVEVVSGSGTGLVIPNVLGSFGWLFLNLNHARHLSVPGHGVPARYRKPAQAWVFSVTTTSDPFFGNHEAVRYDSACSPQPDMVKP